MADILTTVGIGFGMTATAAIRYVDVNGTNPTPPYTNWGTAATVIQDALDAADWGDTVLVTNGVYSVGGRPFYTGSLTNRALIIKPSLVQSVNGPTVTVIQGYQVPGATNGFNAIRCAYLASPSPKTLSGFTLSNGATFSEGYSYNISGGGVYIDGTVSAVVTNCIVAGNTAANTGGGVYGSFIQGSAVSGCALSNNISGFGGGAYGIVTNCLLVGNSAWVQGEEDLAASCITAR